MNTQYKYRKAVRNTFVQKHAREMFVYPCSQFHQRFTSMFFVQNFGAKNHKAKHI